MNVYTLDSNRRQPNLVHSVRTCGIVTMFICSLSPVPLFVHVNTHLQLSSYSVRTHFLSVEVPALPQESSTIRSHSLPLSNFYCFSDSPHHSSTQFPPSISSAKATSSQSPQRLQVSSFDVYKTVLFCYSYRYRADHR